MPLRPALLAAGLLLLPAGGSGQASDSLSASQPAPGGPSLLYTPRRCPAPGEDADIVVCGRRDDDRYRVPPRQSGFDPGGDVPSVSRERNALMEGGEAGIGSCSAVGPGGWTGCFAVAVKRREQQRAGR